MLLYDAVVFDLDGTLTDSQEGIISATRYALEKMNAPIPENVVLRKFLGPPLLTSFKTHCGMTDEEAQTATDYYREYYVPGGWKKNRVYEGIRPLLQQLKKQGAKLYIATAKPIGICTTILEYFGLAQYFDCIAGALNGEKYPTKDVIIGRALQGAAYTKAAMVGDRASDLRGAQLFGIDSIAAGYGYGSEEELRGAAPTHYVGSTAALAQLLLGEVPQQSGYFISMEGLDGCGKTTQMDMLEKYLCDMGYDVRRTREPGGCKISEKIRELLLDVDNKGMTDICEALLYAASRAQHVREVIRPAIENGQIVLCDRFVDSSVAFQGGARDLGTALIQQINAPALDGCFPNATVYLRLDHQTALARRENASVLDRIESEKASFHAQVESAYDQLAQASPDRFVIVDASRSPADVSDEIRVKLLNKLIAAGVA